MASRAEVDLHVVANTRNDLKEWWDSEQRILGACSGIAETLLAYAMLNRDAVHIMFLALELDRRDRGETIGPEVNWWTAIESPVPVYSGLQVIFARGFTAFLGYAIFMTTGGGLYAGATLYGSPLYLLWLLIAFNAVMMMLDPVFWIFTNDRKSVF